MSFNLASLVSSTRVITCSSSNLMYQQPTTKKLTRESENDGLSRMTDTNLSHGKIRIQALCTTYLVVAWLVVNLDRFKQQL
jgi:hypothetical protein